MAFLDISTGEFYVAEGSESYIDKLISNLAPKEVIYQRGYEDRFSDAFGSKLYTYRLDEWVFSEEVNREKLCKQFLVGHTVILVETLVKSLFVMHISVNTSTKVTIVIFLVIAHDMYLQTL